MLDGQILAGLLTGQLNRCTVDDGVRTGKVNVLEYTRGGLALDTAVHGAQLTVFDNADLTGFYIADELCTERVQSAGLGSENVAVVVQQADTQRTEAVRVACRDQLARRHNNQRVGTLDAVHGVHNGFFNRAALEAFLNNGVDQHLGVVRGTENAAVQLNLAA